MHFFKVEKNVGTNCQANPAPSVSIFYEIEIHAPSANNTDHYKIINTQ